MYGGLNTTLLMSANKDGSAQMPNQHTNSYNFIVSTPKELQITHLPHQQTVNCSFGLLILSSFLFSSEIVKCSPSKPLPVTHRSVFANFFYKKLNWFDLRGELWKNGISSSDLLVCIQFLSRRVVEFVYFFYWIGFCFV